MFEKIGTKIANHIPCIIKRGAFITENIAA